MTPNTSPGRARKTKAKQVKEHVVWRQTEAYRLRLLGRSVDEIAEVLDVTPRQIRTDINAAKERCVEELRKLEGRAGVYRQFIVLNHLLDEALAAWERSKAKKTRNTAQVERMGIAPGGDIQNPHSPKIVKQKTAKIEEEQVGNPIFLETARKLAAEIRELLGLTPEAIARIVAADDLGERGQVNEDLRAIPQEELLERYRQTVTNG